MVLGLFAGYRSLDARSFLIKELELVASNTYADSAADAHSDADAGSEADAEADSDRNSDRRAGRDTDRDTDGDTDGGSEAADRVRVREAEGRSSSARRSEFAAAVALLPVLAPKLSLLQTHQYPLERVEEAFHCAADKRGGAIKVTVVL